MSAFARRAALMFVFAGMAAGPVLAQEAPQPAPAREAASEKTTENRYIRVSERDNGSHLHLEIAARTLTKPGAPDVQLVGVTHIGDQAYYDALQEFLDAQSIVLFEGVKPSGAGATSDGDNEAKAKVTEHRQRLLAVLVSRYQSEHRELPKMWGEVLAPLHGSLARLGTAATTDAWGNPQELKVEGEKFDIVSTGADGEEGGEGANADIAFSSQKPLTQDELAGAGEGIQTKLAHALGLKFQLEAIDYSHANWRNSDMSIDEVQKKLEESGASGDALFKMLDGSSFASKLVAFALGFVEKNAELSMMVKVMMIEVLSQADDLTAMAGKQAKGLDVMMKVIVQDRNQEVLKDLAAASKEQPTPKSIALFYGAGHLPDLEQHLTDQGYTFASAKWFTAIDADLDSVPGMKAQAKQIRQMIQRQIEAQKKAASK